jgi:hypothetical protein
MPIQEEAMRRSAAALIATPAMVFAMSVTPAFAQPTEEEVAVFSIFPDTRHDLVVFWNITRDGYCAWEASGFEGEPPVIELVSARENELPSGVVIASYEATRPLELWRLDEGADLSGPCQDTDDSSEPWATGSARDSSNDNDVFHSDSVEAGLNRTNAFGDRGQGRVVDDTGTSWHFSWVFRAVIDKEDNFRDVVPNHTTLSRAG